MSEGYIASDILKDIEDSIKYKLGTQDDYSPPEMPGAIMSIPQTIDARVGEKDIIKNGVYDSVDDYLDGYNHVNVRVPTEEGGGKILPVLKNLDVSENGSYDASDEGADGYDVVNVNVPPVPARLLEVRIEENGVIDPPEGYDGFSKLRVSVLSDANINEKPDEITENGTYEAIDDGLDGYSKVTVNLNIQNEKELTENGTFYPDGTNSGVYKMNVNVTPPLEDAEFTRNGNYTPTGTNYGFSHVNVNVPNPPLEQALFTTNGVYTPSGTNYGFSEVNVSVPLPTLEEKFVTSNGDYYPSSSNYGFSHVNVNVPGYVPVLENREFTQNGNYTPSPGYDGFFKVDVNVPTKTIGTRSDITSNGTYFASQNSLDGFSEVKVNVPVNTLGVITTITQNGVYNANSYGFNGFINVNVQVPQTATFGTKTFTENGLYNANSYGFDGFNQVNIQVPSGGPEVNWQQVVYYNDGTKNVVMNQNRYIVGGYPVNGRSYSAIDKVYIGNTIVDCQNMFTDYPAFNAIIDHTGGAIYDYSYMFYSCSSFNRPLSFNVNSAMNAEYMFGYCETFNQKVNMFSTYYGSEAWTNVSAKGMFYECKNLKSQINIDIRVDGLYDTSNMFYNCVNFNSPINFPNCIKNSKSMFDNCKLFDSDVNFNSSGSYNLLDASFMFRECVIFNSNIKNVTNLYSKNFYGTFWDCYLFNKYIPNLYPMSNGSSDFKMFTTQCMFWKCQRFNQKVNIFCNGSIGNMSMMFNGCSNFSNYINIYVGGITYLSAPDLLKYCNNFSSNIYILKTGTTDLLQNGSYLSFNSIYNRNVSASSQPYRMNIICGSTNIYNAFLRDMSSPPTWTTFSDGVYNTKYNVYVYNHL